MGNFNPTSASWAAAPDNKPENGYQTPVASSINNKPETPHPHPVAPYANAVFGTPSAITTPFNRAVSVPGGAPPSSFSSPSTQVPWTGQDVTNVRNELLKALPFYRDIHSVIESQPEILSRLDVLHYLGVNIHHPHIARPGSLGSLLAIWNQLTGHSNKKIRELKNENGILKIENNNLKIQVANLEASATQSQQEVVGTPGKEGVKEPTRFDGSEPNKYVRYFNFMLWKRAIFRAWEDQPDAFKTEKDKICYILFFLDGDAFWDIADTAEAIVNNNKETDAWEFKTGEQLLGHLAEKYGRRK